ncbi:hypothetical protein BGZ59_004818 [Podila verticillata]|nr:hypothetical protein BGZ59_004818 [Podila verticillata]KFH63566.1 hypothetical protein MVEG_10975 [Podila verticillata NRRL 6337]
MTEIVFPAVEIRVKDYQRRKAAEFNRTVLLNEFADGAKVMSLDPIRGDKLAARYEGPYTVVRKTTGGSYVLKDGTGEELSRKFAPSQLKLVLDDFEETSIYEVEKILDHRERPGEGVEYLVKWRGFEKIKDRTWEPPENFIERKCITDYWKSRDLPGMHSSLQASKESRQMAEDNSDPIEEQESISEQRDDHPIVLNNISSENKERAPKRKRGRPKKDLVSTMVDDQRKQTTEAQRQPKLNHGSPANNPASISVPDQTKHMLNLDGKSAEGSDRRTARARRRRHT